MLNIHENKCDSNLHRLYYHKNCQYFYWVMLFMSFLLILVTIVDGFKIVNSLMFNFFEACLILLTMIDLLARIKMQGISRFMNHQSRYLFWFNWFDFLICFSTCLIYTFSSLYKNELGEVFDTVLLVIWATCSIIRMYIIAKKRKWAQYTAKTLINFDNIAVDTDFGGQTNRSIQFEDQNDLPSIMTQESQEMSVRPKRPRKMSFEMKDLEKRLDNNQAELEIERE